MMHPDRVAVIRLRQEGVTYDAILARFGIAKSTLWRWLKAAGMVDGQSQQYTERRLLAQRKAAAVVKRARIERTQAIVEQASQEIGELLRRDLWLLGLALYWGEGAKQKPGNVSARVAFSNSDPLAVRVFLRWIKEICGVPDDQLSFDIYLHETADGDRARAYWAQQIKVPIQQCSRIRWKRHRPMTRRTNTGDSYHGLMRVVVARSCNLNRRITGWILGIGNSLGSGVMVTRLALDQKIPGPIPGSPVISDGAGWVAEGPGLNRINEWLLTDEEPNN